MNRRFHSAAASLLLTAVVTGCSGRADEARPLQLVRVSARLALANAPLLLADEEGYFASEGIRLQYITLSTTLTQSMPALEQQKVDALAGQLNVGFFNAMAKGARSRIVADRGHVDPNATCDFVGLVGRGSLFGSRDPGASDLKGRRFGVNTAGASGYLAARYLSAKGLAMSDVTFLNLPDNVTIQALEDGSIDAMFATEPRLTPSVLRGNPLIASSNKYIPGLQYGIIVFGPSLLVTNRDLGQRFINAYLKGVRQYNQGKTQRNLDIIARRGVVSADTARTLCFAPIRNNGSLDLGSLLEFQKWGVEQGHQIRMLSETEVSDLEFVRKAAAALDTKAPAR